jgi:hypothetical protein
MRVRAPFLFVLITLLAVSLAPADAGARSSLHAIKKRTRLVTFDSCSGLVAYARKYAPRVDDYYYGGIRGVAGTSGPPPPTPPTGGAEGGAPGGSQSTGDAPQGATPTPTDSAGGLPGDTSGTNVQEQGVDEPDLVKTDGNTLFAIENGSLNAVDARAAEPKLLGSLKLDGWGQEMLLRGKRVLVIGYADFPGPVGPADDVAGLPYWQSATVLTEVDVSDPAAMKVVSTQTIEGSYNSARLNGDTARIVTSSYPRALYPGAPETAEGKVAGWLPSSIVERRKTGAKTQKRLVSCRSVRRPRVFSGLDVLTVLTVDLSKGLPAVDSDSLMTSADTVYASTGSLYVATQKWLPPVANGDQLPPRTTTAIHRFDISTPNETTYRSSGELPGYLLSQWSLSEYKGVLRAATTDSPQWWGGQQIADSESFVTTLKEAGGALAPLGRVGGLGKGERIYAVRFIDDIGFVVTFRQVDPLYTIDLSEPATPKVLGELKIAGYSAYLHPVGKDLLLGVGQNASEQGRRQGTQLSLFDVSDLRRPKRIQHAQLAKDSSSTAEYDHHAFLYWPATKLALIPVSIYGGASPFYGAIGFGVDPAAGISEIGRIEHPKPDGYDYPLGIDRSIVVGDRVLTVSGAGLASNDLNSLGAKGFVAFPQPPQVDYGPNAVDTSSGPAAVPRPPNRR